jgi:hypothetical protein
MTAESEVPIARAPLATQFPTDWCCPFRIHFGIGIGYFCELHLKVVRRVRDKPSSLDERCWVNVSFIHEFADGTIHSRWCEFSNPSRAYTNNHVDSGLPC